jgi:hypothetical protein
MMAGLRLLLVCALAQSAAAFAMGRPAMSAYRQRAAVLAPRSRLALSSAAANPGDGSKWYRVLGITSDATYDEITDAFGELVAAATDDEARIKQLERARDMILDARLKMRLSGKGATVRDPTIKPKKKIDWLAPLRLLRKYVERPNGTWIFKISSIFLSFGAACLAAPGASDQMIMFAVLCGPMFIYSRGMPEPVRDDYGQVRAEG